MYPLIIRLLHTTYDELLQLSRKNFIYFQFLNLFHSIRILKLNTKEMQNKTIYFVLPLLLWFGSSRVDTFFNYKNYQHDFRPDLQEFCPKVSIAYNEYFQQLFSFVDRSIHFTCMYAIKTLKFLWKYIQCIEKRI